MNLHKELKSITEVMAEAYNRRWITSRDGNISFRIGDQIYVTPSGVLKHQIKPNELVKGVIKDGKVIWESSSQKPSGELDMHLKLQLISHEESLAVVHLHPTYTIAALRKGYDLRLLQFEFPELGRYTDVGFNVQKLPAVSKELAEQTFKSMTAEFREGHQVDEFIFADIVGQVDHGVCAVGSTVWDAFYHVERLEHICQIVLASGGSPK